MLRSKLAVMLVLTVGWTAHAQVELERIHPAVVGTGATSTVKAEGKFPVWPVEIVSDRDDVTITCGEKNGDLQVVVAADAVPGVAWVRMHDAKSASTLVPLMIERVAVVLDVEPNDTISKATEIPCPAVIAGKLDKNGDVDMWRLRLSRGQRLVAALTGHRLLNSPMDAVLQLVDKHGNVLAQADDDRGLDPILTYEAPADSDLALRLFAFPETPNSTIGFAGGATFSYVLQVTTASFVDHVIPFHFIDGDAAQLVAFGWNLSDKPMISVLPATAVAPAMAYVSDAMGWQWKARDHDENLNHKLEVNLSGSDVAEELPLIVWGHISKPNEADRVRVKVQAGVTYRAQVESRQLGFPLDSVLRVLKPDNSEVARNDDVDRSQYDAAVEFKAEQDDEFIVELTDLASSSTVRHAYALYIGPTKPHVKLTVDADRFGIVSGKDLEIPVKITRLHGYAQKLEISAVDLPAGVTAATVVSEAKGDSSKSVKIKLTASAEASPFQGPIQFIATAVDEKTGESQEATAATFPINHSLRGQFELNKLWLTVFNAK
jgi:hypothetical protein